MLPYRLHCTVTEREPSRGAAACGTGGGAGTALAAVNDHDLDALVACFAPDYVNETPARPQRGFRGREQVRRNWTQIFAGVPDIRAAVPRYATDGHML
jgi:ketosteroid isomerase-like protein